MKPSHKIDHLCVVLECTPKDLACILFPKFPEFHTVKGADKALDAAMACDITTLRMWRDDFKKRSSK